MKNQNPFKEKLYNHTVPVRDEVWERIEANLPVQKRGFPFLWLSLAGGLFLVGAFITGLALKNNELQKNDSPGINNIQSFTNNTNAAVPEENTIVPAPSEITSSSNSIQEKTSAQSDLRGQPKSTTHIIPIYSAPDDRTFVADIKITEPAEVIHSSSRSRIELADLPGEINLLPIEDPASDMANIMPDPSCYRFSGAGGRYALSVDLFAAPGFSPRIFEDTGGESSLYAIGREATERNQYAWSAGARVNLHLQQGLAVRLGLMYEQIGDIFDYTDTSAIQISTRIDSFFAPDGTFLYTETNTVTILGSLVKKIHNRYTHVDVPLLLSYEVPFGRATIMVNAGPVINLTSSRRGQILDPTLIPKHITPGERDELKVYKNNVGISAYLGVGALLPLTEHLSALIEPRYLYRIKPVTVDNYPLKEHRHFAGLNLGIRYHIN